MKIKALIVSIFLALLIPGLAMSASVEGEYTGVSGKVGIYAMKSMVIEKGSDGDKYTVKFSGGRDLTYKGATLVNNKVQINDKGFMLVITVNGDKATVDPSAGGAVFQRVKK